MGKFTHALKTFHSHYKLFGSDGISFLLKRGRRGTPLIDIRPRGFAQPIYLRNSTEDVAMFYYIFYAKEYDFDCDFTPEVILDCGAHVGLSAIFFANKYPGSKIFCLEPEKANFDLLVKNTASYPNITCLNFGIWSKTTNLKIIDAGYGNWGFITEECDEPGEDTIPALSIDEVIRKYDIPQIDICKINIEGAEKEVFESNYESWIPKTKLISIELHDWMKEGCSKSFFKALTNYNFALSHKGSYMQTRILPSTAEAGAFKIPENKMSNQVST
jgi:FkbM family methyltransferase